MSQHFTVVPSSLAAILLIPANQLGALSRRADGFPRRAAPPDDPERVTAAKRSLEWLLRKVGFGGILLVFFASPGVKLIRDGVRALSLAGDSG